MPDDADWIIYHNPRCGKSRKALELLEDHDISPTIRLYLKEPPSLGDLTELCRKLELPPKELLRTHEPLAETLNAHRQPGGELLATIVANPILLKRPIVVHGNRAVIGIPPDRVLELIRGG